ncbi:HAD-IA family hydrolase [bacterium]|nr:HAD-IA family hydrolase [bacterium]
MVDNFDVILPIFNVLAVKYAKRDLSDLSVEEIKSRTGPQIIKYIGIPFWRIPRAIAAARSEFYKVADQVKVFENIPEVLLELKKTAFIGIVTSNSSKNIEIMLKSNNINYFDFVSTKSKLFKKHNNLKKVIRDRALKSDLENNRVVYIGDEIRDIEAAKRVGMPIISVTWGYNSADALKRFNPTYLAEDPKDIIKIVDEM